MPPFQMKQHDTRPIYMAVLKDHVGEPSEGPLDLTTATSVRMKMRLATAPDTAAPKVDGVMVVEDAVNGIVSYTWQTGDTDIEGSYKVEFQINWADGGIETIPNGPTTINPDGYLDLTIYEDLDIS